MSSPAHDEKKGRRHECSSLFLLPNIITRVITESRLLFLPSLVSKGRGFLASLVELKGNERHSETERQCFVWFTSAAYPWAVGSWTREACGGPVVCITDASSLCVPPALQDMTSIGNRACLSLIHFGGKVLQLLTPKIITKLELIAISRTNLLEAE